MIPCGTAPQTVHFAQGDVGGLVFGEQHDCFTIGDFSGAFERNPMLSPVVVLLQAETGTLFDLNALGLEAPNALSQTEALSTNMPAFQR